MAARFFRPWQAASMTIAAKTALFMPPWILVWVILQFLGFPGTLRSGIEEVHRFKEFYDQSGSLGLSFVSVLNAPALAIGALVPLTLMIGFLLSLLPSIRGKWTERSWNLKPLQQGEGVSREIAAFVDSQASELPIESGPSPTATGFVYPRSWRNDGLAVFGGMFRLWRRDPDLGAAILLHEIAHHKRRDSLLLGVGSPLAWLVRFWFLFLLCLFIIPTLIGASFQAWNGYQDLSAIAPGKPWMADFLAIQGGSGLRILGISAVGALDVAAQLVLPVASIWCMELNADRFAVAATSAPDRYVAQLQSGGARGWRPRILPMLSHPPSALRSWYAARAGSAGADLVALLIFPAAFVVRGIILLVFGLIQSWLGFTGVGGWTIFSWWIAGYPAGVAKLALPLMGLMFLGWPLAWLGAPKSERPSVTLYVILGGICVALSLVARAFS
jgi:Zn-dependent protease with chaperone function